MTDVPRTLPPSPSTVGESSADMHAVHAARSNPRLPDAAQAALFRTYNYGGTYPGGEFFNGPHDVGRLREALDRLERSDPRDPTYSYRSAVRHLGQTDWNGATQDRSLMIQQLRALQYRWERQNDTGTAPQRPSNLDVPGNPFSPRP